MYIFIIHFVEYKLIMCKTSTNISQSYFVLHKTGFKQVLCSPLNIPPDRTKWPYPQVIPKLDLTSIFFCLPCDFASLSFSILLFISHYWPY